MSPASYRAAPPRVGCPNRKRYSVNNQIGYLILTFLAQIRLQQVLIVIYLAHDQQQQNHPWNLQLDNPSFIERLHVVQSKAQLNYLAMYSLLKKLMGSMLM